MNSLYNEILKRIDPDLPFNYHTSDKNRYRIHDLTSVDIPVQDEKSRLDFLQIQKTGSYGTGGSSVDYNVCQRVTNSTTAVSQSPF